MSIKEECVESLVIDVCNRTFLLKSDLGNERIVNCDTYEEFLNVKQYATEHLSSDQIEYAEIAICE